MVNHDQRSGASKTIIPLAGSQIIDAEGRRAQIMSIRQDDAEQKAVIRIENGPQMILPLSLLSPGSNDAHVLPFAFSNVSSEAGTDRIVIPLWQEEARVSKRVIDTGKGVRIHKTVSEREHRLDEVLRKDELVVERRPAGLRVDAANPPVPRQEGATFIVPVLEEMLVVEKQLWLKEEVRVTTNRQELHHPQTVTLRSEHAAVEHFDESTPSSSFRSTHLDPPL